MSDIEKISGIVPNEVIKLIFDKIRSTNGYDEIQELANELILDGYDVQ